MRLEKASWPSYPDGPKLAYLYCRTFNLGVTAVVYAAFSIKASAASCLRQNFSLPKMAFLWLCFLSFFAFSPSASWNGFKPLSWGPGWLNITEYKDYVTGSSFGPLTVNTERSTVSFTSEDSDLYSLLNFTCCAVEAVKQEHGFTRKTVCSPPALAFLNLCNSSAPVESCLYQAPPSKKSVQRLYRNHGFEVPVGKPVTLEGDNSNFAESWSWGFERHREPGAFDTIGFGQKEYQKLEQNCSLTVYFKNRLSECAFDLTINKTRREDSGLYRRETTLKNKTVKVEFFNLTVFHPKPLIIPVRIGSKKAEILCKDVLNPEMSTHLQFWEVSPQGNLDLKRGEGHSWNLNVKCPGVGLMVKIGCCTAYGHGRSICGGTAVIQLDSCANGSLQACTARDFAPFSGSWRFKETHRRSDARQLCGRGIQGGGMVKACEGHWVGIESEYKYGWEHSSWSKKNSVITSGEVLISKNGSCLLSEFKDCKRVLRMKKVEPRDYGYYKSVVNNSMIDLQWLTVVEPLVPNLELVFVNSTVIILNCSTNSKDPVTIRWRVEDRGIEKVTTSESPTKMFDFGCQSGLMYVRHLKVWCTARNDAWWGESSKFILSDTAQDCSVRPQQELSRFKYDNNCQRTNITGRKIVWVGDGE